MTATGCARPTAAAESLPVCRCTRWQARGRGRGSRPGRRRPWLRGPSACRRPRCSGGRGGGKASSQRKKNTRGKVGFFISLGCVYARMCGVPPKEAGGRRSRGHKTHRMALTSTAAPSRVPVLALRSISSSCRASASRLSRMYSCASSAGSSMSPGLLRMPAL